MKEEGAGGGQKDQTHYNQLLGGELVGLFRTTLTGRMMDCNQMLVDILGYASIEQLCKISVKELYFDLADRHKFLEDLAAKKKLNNYEILLKHRNGSAVHVLESVMMREEPGHKTVIEGVVIDITSVRKAEMEQRMLVNNYRQLSEKVRDGILIVQGGKVVFANPAGEDLFTLKGIVGAELLPVVSPEDSESMQKLLKAAEKANAKEGISILFNTGTRDKRPFMVYATPTWYMNAPGIQLTLHDAEKEHDLLKERVRVKIAEEVNSTLRLEIAEHKRTQEALVKSRRLAKSLIDSSLDMIVGVDPRGMINEFNPAASIKFGYEPEDVIGKNSRMLYAGEETYIKVQDEMARFGAYAGEVMNIDAEGKVFISFLAASRLFDEDGRSIGSMGVSRDVTQAKRDQEALKASEERYRDLVDNATDLIQSVDMNGRFLFVNNAWKEALGYTNEELSALTVEDILADEEQRLAAKGWLERGHEVPRTQTWRSWFLTKTQQRILVEGTSDLRKENGKNVAVRSIIRNITASHQAQEQILKHTAKEKALFETSEHLFWTVDRRIALTSFNQGYRNMILRLHGKEPQINLDSEKPRELFAPLEYHDFWKLKYEEAFAGKNVAFETNLTDVDGEQVCNEIYLSPVLAPDGTVVEVFGIGHEITDKKVAEAQVRDQSAKLNAIFESSADVMMWSLDRNMRITACNKYFIQASVQVYGRGAHVGDNMEESLANLVDPEAGIRWRQLYDACFDGRPQHHETHVHMVDGKDIWLELYMSPILSSGQVTGVSCMAHDITLKKRNEQEILESLKEKEVLLKEVHHRVKNNLQIISSIFNLQRDHVGGDPEALELLLESRNRIHSMSFIHESLYLNKNFSQVDFAQYVEGLCRNLVHSYSLSAKVRLQTELQHIMLDLDKAIPCGLILNELISNALKHAFPGGAEGEITVGLKEEGKVVSIFIGDNGSGFLENFEMERDKGLGLELVEMLIGQLDGKVEQSHLPGTPGTAYLITFERS